MASSTPTMETRKRGTKHNPAKWDDDKTKVLLEVFIEESVGGNRPVGIFTKLGWTNVVSKFNARTGLSLTRDQLKNKQDNLKREYTKWESLIGKETGLGWDHAKRTLTAPDDWWIERAKVDPTILRYKDAGPVFLEQMQKLFAGTTANGFHAYIPTDEDPLLADGDHLEDLTVNEDDLESVRSGWSVPIHELQTDAEGPDDGDVAQCTSKLPAKKRKRKPSKSRKSTPADKIVSSMDSISQAMRDSVTLMQARTRPDTDYGLGYVQSLDLLHAIPGMETNRPLYLKGVRVLEDKTRRLAFAHILQDGKDAVVDWLDTFPDFSHSSNHSSMY